MPKLRIKPINDPEEFVQSINVDQNDYLYVYVEDIFEPVEDIYDKIIDTYVKYLPSIMFTDIKTINNGTVSYQHFHDVVPNQPPKVIYSPLFARYLPITFKIHPELEYHSFSFLLQSVQAVLPWHIPQIGFTAKITPFHLQKLSENTQWVMQHGTS